MLLFPDQSQLRCQFVATEEQGKISRAVRVATPRLRASDVDVHEPTNQRVRESVHLIVDIKSRKEIDDRTNKLRGDLRCRGRWGTRRLSTARLDGLGREERGERVSLARWRSALEAR
jgi:hypothetical protein